MSGIVNVAVDSISILLYSCLSLACALTFHSALPFSVFDEVGIIEYFGLFCFFLLLLLCDSELIVFVRILLGYC